MVKFTELTFDTNLPTTDNAYEQFHLRVVVDSQQKYARVTDIKPKRTSDSKREVNQSSSTKSGRTRSMAAALNLGPNPMGTVTANATKTYEVITSSEMTHFSSLITQHRGEGNVQWGFNIEDVSLRKGGIDLEKWGIDLQEEVLPTARFKFVGKSNVPESPPKCMDIAITSYWSLILPSEQKKTWIHKLLRFVKFRTTSNTLSQQPLLGGNRSLALPVDSLTQTSSYTNLFQIVALTADLSKLQEMSHYIANVEVNRPGASDPHNVSVEREAAKSVHMTPIVVKGMLPT